MEYVLKMSDGTTFYLDGSVHEKLLEAVNAPTRWGRFLQAQAEEGGLNGRRATVDVMINVDQIASINRQPKLAA
jgi:hypothetical protein